MNKKIVSMRIVTLKCRFWSSICCVPCLYICCYGIWSHYKQSIALHVKSCIKASWNNFISLYIHIKALLMIENLNTSPWSFVRVSWGLRVTKFVTRAKVPIALMHLSWHICTIWHISFTKILNPSSRSKLHHKFNMWWINNENCAKFVHS